MSLEEKLISSFLAFELDINIQSPVHNIRTKALKEFEKLGFPSKKIRSLEIHFFEKCFKRRLYYFFEQKKCT
jgi:Fe-S cluster assembly protein SufD